MQSSVSFSIFEVKTASATTSDGGGGDGEGEEGDQGSEDQGSEDQGSGNGGGEEPEPAPTEPVVEPELVVCDPVTQTLENGECVDVPVPIIECEPGFVLNEDGDACESVAQTPANTTTPTSTPLTPFQGVIAIPDPDCIAGRSVDNIPACEDPSIAQFAKTCESVPKDAIDGTGFEEQCQVDRNACANADFQLVNGVCQASPPVGHNI